MVSECRADHSPIVLCGLRDDRDRPGGEVAHHVAEADDRRRAGGRLSERVEGLDAHAAAGGRSLRAPANREGMEGTARRVALGHQRRRARGEGAEKRRPGGRVEMGDGDVERERGVAIQRRDREGELVRRDRIDGRGEAVGIEATLGRQRDRVCAGERETHGRREGRRLDLEVHHGFGIGCREVEGATGRRAAHVGVTGRVDRDVTSDRAGTHCERSRACRLDGEAAAHVGERGYVDRCVAVVDDSEVATRGGR